MIAKFDLSRLSSTIFRLTRNAKSPKISSIAPHPHTDIAPGIFEYTELTKHIYLISNQVNSMPPYWPI